MTKADRHLARLLQRGRWIRRYSDLQCMVEKRTHPALIWQVGAFASWSLISRIADTTSSEGCCAASREASPDSLGFASICPAASGVYLHGGFGAQLPDGKQGAAMLTDAQDLPKQVALFS